MLFLLRSAFWLSLVFAALPETSQGPSLSAGLLAQQAASGIESLCAQNPKACLAALSKVAALDASAVPATLTPAILPVSPQVSPAAKPAKAVNVKKAGTLTAGDLTPTWHASPAKM